MNFKLEKGTVKHDEVEYTTGDIIPDLDKKTVNYLKSLGIGEVFKGKVPENMNKKASTHSEDEEDADTEDDGKGGPNTGLDQ